MRYSWKSAALVWMVCATAVLLSGCAGGSSNRPPTITGSPALAVTAGDTYSFTPTVSDPEGDELTFDIENMPPWASFDAATGTLSGVAAEGMYTGITILVSDGTTWRSLPSFSVAVNGVGTGSVTLSWTPPTRNEDDTLLTDLAAFRIHYGTSPGNYPNKVRVDDPAARTQVIGNLPPDTYYFVATAINAGDVESGYSNMVTSGTLAPASVASNQTAAAFNDAHPYVYLNQAQLDALRAHVKSGADDYITRAYGKMKTYGDATLDDSPELQSRASDFVVNYQEGLIDTEKATAWAVCYHVENDLTYANRARAFVLHYVRLDVGDFLLDWVSWKINMMIIYDLTRPAGVFTPAEIAEVQDWITGMTNAHDWCEVDPAWRENMSHWICGMASIASMMAGDEALVARGFTQFKRRIDATGADGRFFDFDNRGSEGLGYSVYSLSPMLFAAQTAKHTGRDWWGYSNNGRSLTNSVDFLTTSAAEKPGADWIPSIYGNGRTGSHSETTGDYGDTLSPAILSDQRFVFEVAQDNRPKAIYEAILDDSSVNRNPREDIFDYHVHYWLATFLNVDSAEAPPRPRRPTGLVEVTDPE